MNRVRQICAATLLTFVLAASSALAGEMPQGIIPPPPPPPPEYSIAGETQGPSLNGTASATNTSMTGDMPGPGGGELNPLTELTLSLLQSVFSLF